MSRPGPAAFRLAHDSPFTPTPPHPQLGVYLADDPVLCAWRGATLLAASPSYPRLAVSQKEWRSRGVGALAKWDQ